jgi:succinate dehydrogenase / fumarate reductase flavoprotein subunit
MDFAGVDPITEPIPIQPGQHYSMGGIDVGIDGQSSLPGLYAAGECACVSVHGANRLGGNSLLETVVFGRLVGESIARDVLSVAHPSTGPVEKAVHRTEEKVSRISERTDGTPLFPLIDSLKETMWTKFGIFRSEEAMRQGLEELRNLKEQFPNVSLADKNRDANPVLIRYFEMEYMLPVAETVALGALARKESRGSHNRLDFPDRDDKNFLKHTLAHETGDGISIAYGPVTTGMFEPEERVY